MYGLLTHFFTRFQSHEGLATWERSVQLGGDRATERHPANHAFTDILIEAQEAYLQLNGLALHKQTGEPWQRTSIPTVCLDIGHEERRLIGTLHEFTDWVLTVDRHFGVEYFDTPNDPYLSTQSHHYLLDYTPEFIDGLGHRLLVTTECKEEVADILGRAMLELGLSNDEESCNELLMTLETISGRLALRLVG
ncbi:MAG: hypothetical protein NT023_04605, partial [Armatimonadetes bacterium]|nr:hypothetical protein [Armatimonadota bacterium]